MISPRYLPGVCVLCALALGPTLIHSYSADVASDGLVTSSIPVSLSGYNGIASSRNGTWGKRRFESDDWMERDYTSSGERPMRLTVIRSFDAKSLYHHPELAVAYGTSFTGLETKRVATHPGIPIHVLKPSPGVAAMGLYALHYDGQFIEDPVWFQIRNAGQLLLSRRKLMTLIFVLDSNAPHITELENSRAAHLLFGAINSFFGGTHRLAEQAATPVAR